MDFTVIPIATVAPPADASGQAPPATMNAAAAQSNSQLVTAGRDSVIPITYGGPDRLAGKLYIARVWQSVLVLVQILGEGPVFSIAVPNCNDQALSGILAQSTNTAGGQQTTYSTLGTQALGIFPIVVTTYNGTATQGVDPILAAAIPGFAEAMAGTAYAVMQVPPGVVSGFPRFTFQVYGRLIYDPRDGTQTQGVPSTWKWSNNPALCLADFLASASFGARKTVDWSSVTAAANYCDSTVTGAAGTEARAQVSLTLDTKQTVRQWIEILRAYVPAWVDYAGGVATIVADMARASDFTFNGANIDSDPKPTLTKRGAADLPTVVQIGYTRTDVTPWATAYAEASTGSTTRRIARIEMPGIQRYSQALRFAVERLNHYQLEDLEGTIGVFEDGLKILLGDRATITDDIGLSALDVRIVGRQDRGYGRWSIAWRKYDPAAYAGSVDTTPSTPSTGLPNPASIPSPTNLVVNETAYFQQVNGSALAGSLTYQSRFDITWTAPVHPYPLTYRVEVYDNATKVFEGIVASTAYSTPALQQGKTYTVKVYARNAYFESTPVVGSQVSQGKNLPPGNVPSIISGQETNGEVYLNWIAAADVDTVRYEWKYGPTGGFSYATATLIDRVDGLRARFKGIPVGTWRFAVKAIDSVGRTSTTETTIDITVEQDNTAFLQSHTFTSPTLVNMAAIPPLEGVNLARWMTSVAGDQFGTVEPNPLSSGSNPVSEYHASATQTWTGETWDLGFQSTGTWTVAWLLTVLNGVIAQYIETSPDGSAWTRQSGVSWQGTTRFVRVSAEMLTTGTFRVDAPPRLDLAAVTRSESAQIIPNASGATLIALANRYSFAQDLQLTPINAATARAATCDRLLLYSQSGLMMSWTQSGASGANDAFAKQNIFGSSRVIVAGDFLEYDVWIAATCPAAVDNAGVGSKNIGSIIIHTAGGGYLSGFTDTNTGADLRSGAGLDVRGQWCSRRVSLATIVGATFDQLLIGSDSDANGDYAVLYRNLRVTNGAGTDRQAVWPPTLGGSIQTEPSANATVFSAFASGLKCGPSNTFNVYLWNSSTGAQVGGGSINLLQWTFKGS